MYTQPHCKFLSQVYIHKKNSIEIIRVKYSFKTITASFFPYRKTRVISISKEFYPTLHFFHLSVTDFLVCPSWKIRMPIMG